MRWITALERGRERLGWNEVCRSVSYLRSALWVVPIVAVMLGLLCIRLLMVVDGWIDCDLTGFGVEGARSLYQTIITLTLSFVVFTFGSLLVAIQIASGQLTPRIIATTLLRDHVIKYTVGLNVFTMLFAVSALNRTGEEVQQLVALLAGLLGISCVASFLFLIDYSARLLRPVRMVALVCEAGIGVIRKVYPEAATARDETPAAATGMGPPARTVAHEGRSQVVLAVEVESLVDEARRLDGIIEFVPQVGDFVATDEPLFHLHGGAARADDGMLRAAVAFGSERTMEQDPTFAFRILADIAFNEVRACGAGSIQIPRRQRAMLENLIATLPAYRHPALREQRDLLDRTLPDFYKLPEDLALARIPDTQGLGGASSARRSAGG